MTRRAALSLSCAMIGIATAIACAPSYDSADDVSSGADASTTEDGDVDSDGRAAAASDADADADADADGVQHTFLDRFDVGPLGAKWTSATIIAPAGFSLEPVGLSPPNALVASLPATTTALAGAYLSNRFGRSMKAATCRTLLFIEDAADTATPTILEMQFQPMGTASVSFVSGGGGNMLAIQQQSATASYPTSSVGLATGRWMDVALEVDVDTRDVAVKVDGKPLVSGAFGAVVRPNTGFDVKLGVFESGANGDAVRMRFDDFSCDVTFD